MNIKLRAYRTEDAPLIYNSWSKNDWYSPKEPIRLEKKEWFKEKIGLIGDLLDKGKTFIAHLDSDPSFIVGYAVFNQNSLQFVYVKKDYRRQGIGALLKKQMKPKEKQDGKELPGSGEQGSVIEDLGEGHPSERSPLS
jgi:hypothetical protein